MTKPCEVRVTFLDQSLANNPDVDVLDLLHELCFHSTLPFCEHCTACFTVAGVWIDKALRDLLVSSINTTDWVLPILLYG